MSILNLNNYQDLGKDFLDFFVYSEKSEKKENIKKYGTYLFSPSEKNKKQLCGYKYEAYGNLPQKICILEKDGTISDKTKQNLLSIGIYDRKLDNFTYFNSRKLDSDLCVETNPIDNSKKDLRKMCLLEKIK